jgi:hypothetical protein
VRGRNREIVHPLRLSDDGDGFHLTCRPSRRSNVIPQLQFTRRYPFILIGVEGVFGRGHNRFAVNC